MMMRKYVIIFLCFISRCRQIVDDVYGKYFMSSVPMILKRRPSYTRMRTVFYEESKLDSSKTKVKQSCNGQNWMGALFFWNLGFLLL